MLTDIIVIIIVIAIVGRQVYERHAAHRERMAAIEACVKLRLKEGEVVPLELVEAWQEIQGAKDHSES